MAYIPEDAQWYVADLVILIQIEDDNRNVVHTNTMLVRADSPDEAYFKALELGKQEEDEYTNVEGKIVTATFMGLAHLVVVMDDLEHGAELFYSEKIGLEQSDIQKLVLSKDRLEVFKPITAVDKPDYAVGEIVTELLKNI